jgi:hypothetical protein
MTKHLRALLLLLPLMTGAAQAQLRSCVAMVVW